MEMRVTYDQFYETFLHLDLFLPELELYSSLYYEIPILIKRSCLRKDEQAHLFQLIYILNKNHNFF
jgi:hypothetical protein